MAQPSKLVALLCVMVAISLCCQVFIILTRESRVFGKERELERQAADYTGVFKQRTARVEGVLKQTKGEVGFERRAAELEGEKELKGFKHQSLRRQVLGENEDTAHHFQYMWQRRAGDLIAGDGRAGNGIDGNGIGGDSREVGRGGPGDRGVGMQNSADIKDSANLDDRHHMEQVGEPVKRVVQFQESADSDELGDQVGEPVKQVLQSNEILSDDGVGVGYVEMDAKGKGDGLEELERVLPPVDDVPSDLDDQNEYELDNDNAEADGVGENGRHSGAAKVVESDLLLSRHQNGAVADVQVPKVQGKVAGPPQSNAARSQLPPPNHLGSDYDTNRAVRGNKFEVQRNSREDPLSPPSSNPVLEKGVAEAHANQKAGSNDPLPKKGVAGAQANPREGPSPPPNNPLSERKNIAKKLVVIKRSGVQSHPGRVPQSISNGAGAGAKKMPNKDKKTQRHKFILSPGLYQMIGSLSPPFSRLEERGFAEHYQFSSSHLRDRWKYVHEVVSAVEPSRKNQAVTSLNIDLLERGKFQRYQTDQFCGQNRIPKALPSKMEQLDSLFKHLLYDDSKKIVVCYVPKNGCSNLKRMMLVLNGLLPPNASLDPYNRPSEKLLGSVHSFRNLTQEQAIYKLKNYYKFAIVRNPLERLLSAYKNKLETPLDAKLRKKFPDRLKAYLLDLYDHQLLKSWISAKNYSGDVHPTFQQLIKFMTQFSLNSYNEHFVPFMQLCFPCAIDYDLVVNFKTLNYDMYGLMEYLGIPPSYYPAAIGHVLQPTSVYMKQYYKRVQHQIKADLFHKLQQELDYYYTLHPEEEGMHKHL